MGKRVIEVNKLNFSYGETPVLQDCSFSIEENTITVLLGANGAGKSTLFACLMKQLKSDHKSVMIDSVPLENMSLKELSRIMSFVPQINAVNNLDCMVRDYLVEGRTPYLNSFSIPGKKEYLISEKYASMVGISHLLSKNIQHLSGGELQLVLIARALVQETPIILMDEPMSALDLGNQVKILKLIEELKRQSKTILFSSHNPNHALVLDDNACMIKDGKVIASGVASSCITQENLCALYGNNVVLKATNDCNVCTLSLV